MSTPVSTLLQTVNLQDNEWVDHIPARRLYRASPYELKVSFYEGSQPAPAGQPTQFKIYNESGELLSINGAATDEKGVSVITIDQGQIDFDGQFTGIITINGSKAADFPLTVQPIGTPVPPPQTVIDWSAYSGYDNTLTSGPYLFTGDGQTTSEDAQGRVTVNIPDGGAGKATEADLQAHINDDENPHQVTAAQVGADPAGSAAGVQSNLTAHINTEPAHGGDLAGTPRPPTAHASTHSTGGSDELTPADIGADPAGSAAGVQGNLDTHTGATTGVHGIADTADLILEGDARLTDERVPTDGSVTDAKVSATANIAQNKVANLVGDLAAKANLVNGKVPTNELPAIAITETFVVADIAARDALTPEQGDVAIVQDRGDGESASFIWDGTEWQKLLTPQKGVSDVSGIAPISSTGGDTPSISLDDLGVTEAKLADGAVTNAKVAANADIAPTKIAGTAIVEGDARLTDARVPKGGAGGVLSGQYPNPGFAVAMATQQNLANAIATRLPLAGGTMSGNIDMGDNSLTNVHSVVFEPDGAAPTKGLLAFDDERQSLKYYDEDLNLILVGENVVIRVRNTEGATINKGQVVFISGATGGNVEVKLAGAAMAGVNCCLGVILSTSINNNASGKMVTTGRLAGIDTSGFTEGQTIWLSDTPGQFTATPPALPSRRIRVGVVARVHPTEGVIQVSSVRNYDAEIEARQPLDSDLTAYANAADAAARRALIGAPADADVVKKTGNQTVDGIKTFLQRLVSNELRARTDDGLDISKSDGTSLIRVGKDGATKTGVAEGNNTIASGESSHAEGDFTTASGDSSHAEGVFTTASGATSHAGGVSSLAQGNLSYARGRRARSIHIGASIESDNQNADFNSEQADEKAWRFSQFRFVKGIARFFAGIRLENLTADRPLALDASKNAISPTPADFRTLIGLPTATEGEMEAGTETELRAMSPELVAKAIAELAAEASEVKEIAGFQLIVAASDEFTNLTQGPNKVTFRVPREIKLTEVRASVNTPPAGSAILVDIKQNASSIFSTELRIDAGAKTSVGSSVPAVISTDTLTDDAELVVDIVQVGSSVPGTGLKITLLGYRL